MSLARQHNATIQGSLYVIAKGGRPSYRCTQLPDGRWAVDFPGLHLNDTERRSALVEARAAIARLLEVDPGAFDVVGM